MKKGKSESRFKKPKSNELNNAIKRADALFSKALRAKYDRDGFTNCATCFKPLRTFGGVFGAHCGHLYPKSKYWLHRWDIRNAAPQCYQCNVNQEGQQIAMFDFLKGIHGEAMEELKAEIKDFEIRLNTGMLKKKPDILFIQDVIKNLKYVSD